MRTIYLSPCGTTFRQADAVRLRDDYDQLILVCGHYEGIDERFIDECVDEEISLGDFVLTGGEIPAMAVADAVCRLVPGVLSDPECYRGGEPLGRAAGISPVLPARGMARPGGASHSAFRSPRQRGQMAPQTIHHPNPGSAAGHVRQTGSELQGRSKAAEGNRPGRGGTEKQRGADLKVCSSLFLCSQFWLTVTVRS